MRVDRLVQHQREELDTPFLVPTPGKGDPEMTGQLPWRGRISPLLNYLICEGLRQYGSDDIAEVIALSSLEMLRESREYHHQVFPSYNALSGPGTNIPQDPLAPKVLLLGVLGIGMLIDDTEPWDGIRLENLRGVDMAVDGLSLFGHLCNVASGPRGLSVTRDNESWINFDRPAILRNLSTQARIKYPAASNCRAAGRYGCAFTGISPGSRCR